MSASFDFRDLRSALTTCEQMQGCGVEMRLIFAPGTAAGFRPAA